jgi:hypothetical protein
MNDRATWADEIERLDTVEACASILRVSPCGAPEAYEALARRHDADARYEYTAAANHVEGAQHNYLADVARRAATLMRAQRRSVEAASE